MIIHPPAIEADSQLQKQLCRWGLRASVAQQVQSGRYSVLGLKIQALRAWYATDGVDFKVQSAAARLRRRALHKLKPFHRIVESRRWAALYGILSGPCMI